MAAAGIGRRRRKDGEEEGEEKRGDWLLKEPKNAEWLLSSCNRNRPFQFHVANNNAAASSFRPTHPDGKANLTQFSVMPDSGLLFSREEKLKFASRMLNRLLSSNKKVYTPTSNDRGSDPWLRSEPRRKSSVIQSIQNNIVIQDALCTSRAALTSSKIRSRADRNKYESPLPSPVQSLPPNVEQKLNITSLSVENHDQLAPSPGKTLESIHTQILRVRSPNKLEVVSIGLFCKHDAENAIRWRTRTWINTTRIGRSTRFESFGGYSFIICIILAEKDVFNPCQGNRTGNRDNAR
eukprot:762602-Hanusia_phi.AAC.3